MPLCRLCQLNRQLRNSHIVSEFLYDDLYNSKGHAMAITGLGNRGWKPLQQGSKEHLFCENCEQHFNEYYEKPFLAQWVKAAPLPNPWNVNSLHLARFDYAPFKLFHLSVLFRASVSSRPEFVEVSLGPHEEKLRELLLSRNPGEAWQYPIFGQAIVHHETKRLISMVSQAVQSNFEGHRCMACFMEESNGGYVCHRIGIKILNLLVYSLMVKCLSTLYLGTRSQSYSGQLRHFVTRA